MVETIQKWQQALEDAWNKEYFDNDLFVQEALNVMREMKKVIDSVEMFEKE